MDRNLDVLLIDSDENSRSVIKSYLSEINGVGISAEFSDFERGFSLAAESGKCAVIVDISENLERTVSDIKDLKTKILSLNAAGKSSIDIARELGISITEVQLALRLTPKEQ